MTARAVGCRKVVPFLDQNVPGCRLALAAAVEFLRYPRVTGGGCLATRVDVDRRDPLARCRIRIGDQEDDIQHHDTGGQVDQTDLALAVWHGATFASSFPRPDRGS